MNISLLSLFFKLSTKVWRDISKLPITGIGFEDFTYFPRLFNITCGTMTQTIISNGHARSLNICSMAFGLCIFGIYILVSHFTYILFFPYISRLNHWHYDHASEVTPKDVGQASGLKLHKNITKHQSDVYFLGCIIGTWSSQLRICVLGICVSWEVIKS